jgi:hypothetical protein
VALTRGSTGSAVRELQEALKEAGFDPGPIDGVFGPQTTAALNKFKASYGGNPNGIAGPNALANLGLEDSEEGDGEGARMNIPGSPELWSVDGEIFLVYAVPETEPPVYMSWTVPSEEDAQSFFGPGQDIVFDQTMTAAEMEALGVLDFGNTDELANFDDDPFASWVTTMETEAATQPWILDEDYQALIAMAVLEGRSLTDAEIQSTGWWQNHTEAQREWMKLYHGDPEEAQSRLRDNQLLATQQLEAAGLVGFGEDLVEFMAGQVTMGNWSTTYYDSQVEALSDPHSQIELDADLMVFQEGLTTTIGQADRVRSTVNRWLGPQLGQWDDEQINEWAGTLRNDPNGEQRLVEHLKNQRLALFPEYEDRNLSYEDIASPWRSYAFGVWGQKPDEMDPMFAQLVRNNDVTLNGQLLRKEGLRQGIAKVEQDASSALLRQSGTVRRAEG